MTLYGYFRSSAAYRVRIALNLKGLAYERVSVHLRKGDQHAPDFRRLNPQGLVPALVDDGLTLTQSLAIIEYLDETHPSPPLLPVDAVARARVRALAQLVACDVHPIDNLRVLRYLARDLGQDAAAVERWYNHWIADGLAAMEASLAASPDTGRFCHGDRPGLADLCLVPQVANAGRYASFDLGPYPTVRRIVAACNELPAFIDAMPANQPDFEA